MSSAQDTLCRCIADPKMRAFAEHDPNVTHPLGDCNCPRCKREVPLTLHDWLDTGTSPTTGLGVSKCRGCGALYDGGNGRQACPGRSTVATLVERLRNDWGKGYGDMSKVSLEAADALEAKDAEIERLRKVVHRAHRAQGMGPCICVDCEGRGYDD